MLRGKLAGIQIFSLMSSPGSMKPSTSKKSDGKLDLGDFLGRSKEGFQPLKQDDDDEAPTLSSDSDDLEEFSVPALRAWETRQTIILEENKMAEWSCCEKPKLPPRRTYAAVTLVIGFEHYTWSIMQMEKCCTSEKGKKRFYSEMCENDGKTVHIIPGCLDRYWSKVVSYIFI